jgi:hypothetical protein
MFQKPPKGGHGRPAVIAVISATAEIYERKWRSFLFAASSTLPCVVLFFSAYYEVRRVVSATSD